MPEQTTDILAPEVRSISLGIRERVYLFGVLLAIVVICHVPSILAQLIFVDELDISTNDVLVFIIAPVLCYVLMILVPLFAGGLHSELAGFNLRWFKRSKSEIVLGIVLPFVAFAAGAGITAVVRYAGLSVKNPIMCGDGSYVSLPFIWANIFILALLAPFFEEIFYRGYIQSHFERVIGPRIAWVFQALVFTVFHFRPLGGSLTVLVYGLIFGFWRYKRRTLLPVIIAHVIGNSIFCIVFWSDAVKLRQIKITTDYVAQCNEASKPQGYNAEDNAARYYDRAFELTVEMPEGLQSGDFKLWPEDLSEKKRATLEEWVAANGEAIEALELGTRQSYWWVEHHDKQMSAVMMPYLTNAKTLAYATVSRAKLKAVEHDFRQSFSDVLVCYRFGLHELGPKSLIEQLVGIAVCSLTANNTFQILAREEIPIDVLRDFHMRLEELLSDEGSMVSFTADRLFFYDAVQRTFTDDGSGSGHIPKMHSGADVPKSWKTLGVNLEQLDEAGWYELDRRETMEVGKKVYDYLDYLSTRTPAQLRRDGEDFEAKLEQMVEGNSFVWVLIPAYAKVLELASRAEANTQALVATTAVLTYERDRGQLPESLEKLAEIGYLKGLPADPFGDGPLVFRKVGDNFTVYSVGADFEDDDGAGSGDDGGDYVFWPPQAVNSEK